MFSFGKPLPFFDLSLPSPETDLHQARHTLGFGYRLSVRRAMKRNGLNIETRDVKRSESAREELLAGGGILKVPCLRIEDGQGRAEWMYESSDIISYLERRFDPAAQNTVAA